MGYAWKAVRALDERTANHYGCLPRRKQSLGLRNPEDIPVAGVTLRELMSGQTTPEAARCKFTWDTGDLLRDDDEVWHFRTPTWTWQNMGGVEGFVVLRNGLAAHWLVTRMN